MTIYKTKDDNNNMYDMFLRSLAKNLLNMVSVNDSFSLFDPTVLINY